MPVSTGDSAQDAEINLWLVLLRVHLSSLLPCEQAFSRAERISSPHCNVVGHLSGSRITVMQRFDAHSQFPWSKAFHLSICVLHMINRMWKYMLFHSLLFALYCSKQSVYVAFLRLFHYTPSRPENTVNWCFKPAYLLTC